MIHLIESYSPRTNMTIENAPLEDIFPIENVDFPSVFVRFQGCNAHLHHDLYTPKINPYLRESPYMTTTTGSMYRGDNLLGRIVRISRFANLAVYELDGRMEDGSG